MNRLVLIACMLALVLALPSGLSAQGEEKKEGGDPAAEMKVPEVPVEMEQLANWVGEWKVVFGGPGQEPEEGTYVVRKGLMDRAYIGDFKLPGFEGHAVYSFDSNGKKWHMFWFDCMVSGHVGDWTGEVKDGTLTVEAMEDMGSGPQPMRITEKWEGKDKVNWTMEAKQGDAWGPVMTGTYTRTK